MQIIRTLIKKTQEKCRMRTFFVSRVLSNNQGRFINVMTVLPRFDVLMFLGHALSTNNDLSNVLKKFLTNIAFYINN